MATFSLRHMSVLYVGDKGVGKTSMILSTCHNDFFEHDVPQIQCNHHSIHNNQIIAHVDSNDSTISKMSDIYADVIVLMFSIVDRKSLDSLEEKWLRILDQPSLKNIPIIIVGNKCDLRGRDGNCLSQAECLQSVTRIEALAYMEYSGKTQSGLHDYLDSLVMAYVNPVQLITPRPRRRIRRDQPTICTKRSLKITCFQS
ncbi:Ras-related protein [Acrasis kona]|uniref:Ras-related protein n=1 Tax=Acrasis kona TaxID=1008807 RepID=A0AAW2YPB2_9EUKA